MNGLPKLSRATPYPRNLKMEPQRRAARSAIGLLTLVALSACGKVGPAHQPGPMWGAPGRELKPAAEAGPRIETIDARDRDQREPAPQEPRS